MSPAEPSRDSREDRIRELLARCLDRIQDGGRAAAAAELAAHPELRAEVEAGLDKLERAGLLASPAPADPIPERLGDFRLVRRLGAGGMGVVFLAVQESLGREVALKVVRPEQLFFPGARERFRREVETVAKLQDPGIVPILTVGEEAGIPYFAMERVLGASLAEVLVAVHGREPRSLTGRDFAAAVAARAGVPVPEPLPPLFAGSWVAACCRVVQQMALAAQHAHARAVLHRDLKPSNAMVTPTGRVLLLDFGLAATAGASKLTRTGSQPGTVYYMAPEQLADLPLDARTDVYALGVTLHELLALRPPFDAESGERLRAAILGGAPASPRVANPAVPRDVATIVAGALDRDPARRYASAQELADDLERALTLRPIAARPAGPLLRATRACQRHPIAATASALLLVSALATPFLIDLARADVDALQQAAAADLQQALAAIQQLRDQATAAELHDLPDFDPVRARQLDAAITMLRQLQQRHGEKPAVRWPLVTALEGAALVRSHLGQQEEADGLLDEAERELAVLLAAEPGKAMFVLRAAVIAMRRGGLLVQSGEAAAAAASWQKGADGLVTLAAATDASPEVLTTRGACLAGLARIRQAAGDLDAAETLLREAVVLDRRALAKSQATDVQVHAAKTTTNLASLLRVRGAFGPALAEFERVQQVYEALLAGAPKSAELRRELARCRLGIAQACRGLGDVPRSLAAHRAAQQGFDALVAEFENRPTYRRERGLVAMSHAETLVATDANSAIPITRSAIASHEDLIARLGPAERAEAEAELAMMVGLLAVWLASTDDDAECEALFERCVALSVRLAAARPDDSYLCAELASARCNLGRHWLASGAPDRAIPVLQQAVSDYGEAERLGARVRDEHRLPNGLLLLAHAGAAADRSEVAIDALRQRQKIRPESRPAMAELGERLHLASSPAFQALLESIPP